MKRWQSTLAPHAALYVAALWWGSLTALGAWVVPTLFAKLESTRLAGRAAAQLFSSQAMASVVCGVLLLILCSKRPSEPDCEEKPALAGVPRHFDATVFIVTGLFVALVVEFAIAPKIALREQLALWHSIASALLFVQWLCAARVLAICAAMGGSSHQRD
jgi:hypothetical protein